MTDIDCTQYLATSAKTGEILTRDGRVLVSTKTGWEQAGRLVGQLIPCPRRPFGAVDFIHGTEEEVTVDEIYDMVITQAGIDDRRLAERIHARVYGQKAPMGQSTP